MDSIDSAFTVALVVFGVVLIIASVVVGVMCGA